MSPEPKAQMAVPRKGHEDVGADEQANSHNGDGQGLQEHGFPPVAKKITRVLVQPDRLS